MNEDESETTRDRATRPPPWQWYPPRLRSLWQPSVFRPPPCANAGVDGTAANIRAPLRTMSLNMKSPDPRRLAVHFLTAKTRP